MFQHNMELCYFITDVTCVYFRLVERHNYFASEKYAMKYVLLSKIIKCIAMLLLMIVNGK